jgi:uncharacterized membrane protein
MIKCAKEMRATAAAALKGKWGSAVLTLFVLLIVSCVASAILAIIPFLNIIASLATMILAVGFEVAFLTMLRTGEKMQVGCIFDFFKETRLWATILLMLLYTFLWSLLLVVPGIIKGFSYAMTPFILKDNPNMKNNEAIELSMAMMDGHKWDLFCLELSFIGWAFLCVLSLGIGYLWLIPYMYASYAAFYEDVKNEYASRSNA